MESVKLWFQDWSDACEYAKECIPDLSFMVLPEPYSAFASIAIACSLIWWWNERQINRLLDFERHNQAGNERQTARTGKPEPIPDQVGADRPPRKIQAA